MRKSGAWYTYEGDQLGQGKENARNFLRDNPDLANEIEKRIKEKLGVGPRLDADASDASANAGNGSANGNAANGRQRRPAVHGPRLAVPGCRHRPGCHGLAHDPQGRASGSGEAGCPRPRPTTPRTLKPAPGRSACGC